MNQEENVGFYLLCLPLVLWITVKKWEQAVHYNIVWIAYNCVQHLEIDKVLYDVVNAKINDDWRMPFAGPDIMLLLCLYQWVPTRSCCRRNRGLCTCLNPTPWWQYSYCTLGENFELKSSSFLLFSLLYCYHCSFASLISYALFALLKLSGFWVLCFPNVFSSCTALGHFVWYVTLNAIYGDLIYYLILSNLASLFMYFVLLSQNYIFPINKSNLVLKESPSWKKDWPHI